MSKSGHDEGRVSKYWQRRKGPGDQQGHGSQANMAKLLSDNPTLMRLRELEVLEKIATAGNLNVVLYKTREVLVLPERFRDFGTISIQALADFVELLRERAKGHHHDDLVVDVRNVRSAGAAFVGILVRVKRQERPLRICSASKHIASVFAVCGCQHFLCSEPIRVDDVRS